MKDPTDENYVVTPLDIVMTIGGIIAYIVVTIVLLVNANTNVPERVGGPGSLGAAIYAWTFGILLVGVPIAFIIAFIVKFRKQMFGGK